MRNFLSRFSQSVDMQKGILYLPRSTRSLSSWWWTRAWRVNSSSKNIHTILFSYIHRFCQREANALKYLGSTEKKIFFPDQPSSNISCSFTPKMINSFVKQVKLSPKHKLISILKSYDSYTAVAQYVGGITKTISFIYFFFIGHTIKNVFKIFLVFLQSSQVQIIRITV